VNEISLPGAAPRISHRLLAVLAALLVYAAVTAGLYRGMAGAPPADTQAVQVLTGATPVRRNVAIADGRFYVDGAPFFIQAVGWDPARPGELPWTRQFRREEVELDFRRIRQAGFNTLRTWAALSAEELTLAEQHGLRVLHGVWVPPDADFADPQVRRQVLRDVARSVDASRWSPAVIGYLVLNEPRASAVATAGLAEMTAFLREVVATVRALDPAAPIGFANWPGMEALDDDLLDFVAFNIYPHRPRVLMDELGLAGYVRMVQRTIARGRPLLISEFGISVSPQRPETLVRRGGATEQEQASQLVELAQTFAAAGAAGTAVFQWNDGWWKNNEQEGDEQTQDPADPEEWFGLIRFEGLQDRQGQPRPALAALAQQNRVALLAPTDGLVEPSVPVRLFSSEPIGVEVSISGSAWRGIELQGDGRGTWEGSLALSPSDDRHDLTFQLVNGRGELIRTERRLVRVGRAGLSALQLSPARVFAVAGQRMIFEVHADPKESAGRGVTLAAYTEDRYNEQRQSARFDARGRARFTVVAPEGPTMLTVVAFEDDPQIPPAERAASWASIEVGKAP
jgi:hypothetical protein